MSGTPIRLRQGSGSRKSRTMDKVSANEDKVLRRCKFGKVEVNPPCRLDGYVPRPKVRIEVWRREED